MKHQAAILALRESHLIGCSVVQRRCKISYTESAKKIEEMIADGVLERCQREDKPHLCRFTWEALIWLIGK